MSSKSGNAWTLLLDYGPLLAFFAAYKFAGSGLEGTLVATVVFMIAAVVSIAIGLLTVRRVSPMVWLSTILIVGFGGVTLYLHDPRFIQMKPTIIYVLFAALIFGGLVRRKAALKWLFGPVFPGLSEAGWLKLSRNWGLFFVGLAIANEIMRATLSFDSWLTLKVWGVSIASFLFAVANVPMLLRHGLDPEHKTDVAKEAPVE
jgi:intracellular septation protein